MGSIYMIILTAVLLVQTVLFVLFFLEERRNDLHYKAALDHIDRRIEDADCREEVEESVNELLDAFGKKIDECFELQSEVLREMEDKSAENFRLVNTKITENCNEVLRGCEAALAKQGEETKLLVDGLTLDYSQAQEAAGKVNDFGASLANIFDYDPLRAIRKGRKKEAD